VERRHQFHYILILLGEFNNVLPYLEICDQIKKIMSTKGIELYLFDFKNKLVFKMIGDLHE